MHIRHQGKSLSLPVVSCSPLQQFRGLMFRSRNTKNLLFGFPSTTRIALHSWFVFFPFLVLWLDAQNNVQEWRVVRPFTSAILPQKPFSKIVEVPLTDGNAPFIKIFVGKERFK